ncbi:MAG: hypothetical protein DSY83_03685 [Flavobacteriia bacterium]|uniref:Uncharacterized protein n=1 Tax=Flagellimonas profundi TaxID=2915620 RepID=A0ABS3FCU4_9FLAO|nr:hypothetical protein [Allomuricauda profundi]MBO0340989.1 hypothetical protein [Allomuricauda profundi]RUA17653.1 MAG: hypothetical protein DSY83_03685 [Flavobacteriia bacterium]
MNDSSKIRINLTTREVEIQGSEEFIAKYNLTIDSFLEKIYDDGNYQGNSQKTNRTLPDEQDSSPIRKDDDSKNKSSYEIEEEPSFGELYNKMPNSAKDVDKMLLAGYFAQKNSDDRIFSTRDASSLLVEQGVKLSNPSASMQANMATKKVFKHKGGYRISETGMNYIKNNFNGE